jgi:hypothetical protein
MTEACILNTLTSNVLINKADSAQEEHPPQLETGHIFH